MQRTRIVSKDERKGTFRARFSLSRYNFVLSFLSTDLLVKLFPQIKTRDPSQINKSKLKASIKYPMTTPVLSHEQVSGKSMEIICSSWRDNSFWRHQYSTDTRHVSQVKLHVILISADSMCVTSCRNPRKVSVQNWKYSCTQDPRQIGHSCYDLRRLSLIHHSSSNTELRACIVSVDFWKQLSPDKNTLQMTSVKE